MEIELLKGKEVDLILRYPLGKTEKLAKANQIAFIELPGGQIRFDKASIEQLIRDSRRGVTIEC